MNCGDVSRQRRKGFGLRGASCGKVTTVAGTSGRWGALLGLCSFISLPTLSPVMSVFLQGGHLCHWKFHALLFVRNEVRESFLYLLFLRCLLVKIINISIVAYFGVTYWFLSRCSSYLSRYVQCSLNIYIEFLHRM